MALEGESRDDRFEDQMAQVVVYARRATINRHRGALSGAIHGAIMRALAYPPEKRFQRFIAVDGPDFVYPEDRGDAYTIIEISMFEGRSDEAKRALIAELFVRIEAETGIAPQSVEITLTETPKVNWGIRGANAADLTLGYRVDV
ncbi:tautomerase family protein [Leifsonia sp. McL0607]|uniref:tautomerase family protein n=1 Tax=Leifsonia sp. McL0607 TaxID=3415672 RepID=UPI003CF13595